MSLETWPARKSESALAAPVVGTMNFGKRTPEPEAARIVARALERGVTWFDVANAYGEGESERILGRALKGHRSEVKVATKVGIGTMKGPNEGLAPARITAALDESLAWLGVEKIDLYYLHAPDSKTPINPLAGGLLAGKGLDGRIEPGSRFDSNPPYQRRYLSDRFLELARACAALAAEAGLTPAQLAHSWIAQRPGVDSVLLGPASADQLDAGIDGCALALPTGVAAKVDDLHRTYAGTDVTYARS